MKKTLNTEVVMGKSNVKFDEVNENYLLVKITGSEVELDRQRAPLAIVALIDGSSSMAPEYKIGYLKKSLIKMIDNMKSSDYLSLVLYDSSSRVLMDLTQMNAENKKKASDIVSKIGTGGCTNFSAAFSDAYDILNKHKEMITAIEGVVVRTLHFTDGCPTAGITDKGKLLQMARNIPVGQVTAMGYGKQSTDPFGGMTGMSGELDPMFLQELSKQGKGNYYYMDTPDNCARAFAYELAGLLCTVGQKVSLTIESSKHMEVLEVLDDVTSEMKDGKVIVEIPDIMSEEEKYVLLKVKLAEQTQSFPRATSVAKIMLAYVNDDGEKVTEEFSAKVSFVKDGEQDTKWQQEIETQLAVIDAIEAQQRAQAAALRGDYGLAKSVLDASIFALNSVGTDRALKYGGVVGSLSDMVKDRSSWGSNQHTYTASCCSFKTGRSSGSDGGVFANKAQTEMFSDFKESIDEQPAADIVTNTDDAPNIWTTIDGISGLSTSAVVTVGSTVTGTTVTTTTTFKSKKSKTQRF